MVIPIPDSGVPSAIGYAEQAGIPFELGITRNHYVGRTFIQPKQSIRSFGVRLKHNANRTLVAGKRIVLIDDSIVRGTTSVKIVQMMRDAGAKEIHFRCHRRHPHSDFYGIDTPRRSALASTKSVVEMCEYLGADSLAFLSIEGIYQALGHKDGRNVDCPQYTDHCFTGDYHIAGGRKRRGIEQPALVSLNGRTSRTLVLMAGDNRPKPGVEDRLAEENPNHRSQRNVWPARQSV